MLKIRVNSWLRVTFLKILLGNKTRVSIDYWTSRFVDRVRRNGYRPGALRCLGEHKRKGHQTILATASPDFYVIPLTRGLGFDDVVCTETGWTSEQRFTGRLERGNCYGETKLARLKSKGYLSGEYHTVAYSDHHSDLLLLKAANIGIAVHPTKELKQVVDYHNMEVAYWDH